MAVPSIVTLFHHVVNPGLQDLTSKTTSDSVTNPSLTHATPLLSR